LYFFVLVVFVLYFMYSMLSVSLDCPFLIAHCVFANVYFDIERTWSMLFQTCVVRTK